VLIVSVHPVSAVIAAGRPAPLSEAARAQVQATGSQTPASALSGLTRPLLDPATQLAAQDVRRNSGGGKTANPTDLSQEEQAQVQSLRNTDREVRQHERAHSNAGGPYAGVPTYQQVRGPDGRMYAVSGEVSIDASPASSPEATITKMDIVIRAALAPVNPSAQDHAVANKARQQRNEAVAEKRTEEREERGETSDAVGTANVPTLDPRPAIAEAATSTYRRIADLIAEPLGLVTPQTTVEIVV
jgi:SprA-related family